MLFVIALRLARGRNIVVLFRREPGGEIFDLRCEDITRFAVGVIVLGVFFDVINVALAVEKEGAWLMERHLTSVVVWLAP